MVRELFEMARTKKACLIFFDEIDAVGGARFDDGAGGDNEVQRTMLELINQVCYLCNSLNRPKSSLGPFKNYYVTPRCLSEAKQCCLSGRFFVVKWGLKQGKLIQGKARLAFKT